MSTTLDSLLPGKGFPCPQPRDFIEYVAFAYNDFNQMSTFSAAIYDTAWLSMVYAPGESPTLYFPECFEHLLRTQEEDGSWASYGTYFDKILNTLAALLSLSVHREKISDNPSRQHDIAVRIKKAISSARHLLKSWNVSKTMHVGFEVLTTGLLRQLASYGIRFIFPGKGELDELNKQKMRRFSPKMIYANVQTTILHSVEALCGEIDFDNLSHHCTAKTGILGSPSATAAYLICSSKWDSRAAEYLETVVKAYSGRGEVPSAFPTGIFELSWAFSSLVPSCVKTEELDPTVLEKFSSFFVKAMEVNGGVVGFAHGLLPDADDTSRVLMALNRLEKPIDVNPMVQHFQTETNFKTYQLERNPSFSANCNVLLALLESEDLDQYAPQISKTLLFLIEEWEAGRVSDKWNIAPQYGVMLLSEVLTTVWKRFNTGKLQDLPTDIILNRIPIIFCQICASLLGTQRPDGSWDASLEKSSYGVRTLSYCLCLPWNSSTNDILNKSFERGRTFISEQYPRSANKEYIWVEKTLYQTALLEIAYCVLATNVIPEDHEWQTVMSDCFVLDFEKSKRMSAMLSRLPIFSNSPFLSIDLILLEARHSNVKLTKFRHLILDRDALPVSKDKYLDIINMIWVACNHMSSGALSSNIVHEMSVLSMLNYQVDELIDSVVSDWTSSQIERLASQLRREHGSIEKWRTTQGLEKPQTNGNSTSDEMEPGHSGYLNGTGAEGNPFSYTAVVESLNKFIAHVCQHPAVLRSPPRVQKELALELHKYILGQLVHALDNRSLQSPDTVGDGSSLDKMSYYTWVHTIAADDTSCPFSLLFFVCLISTDSKHCFQGPQALYYSHALSFHLSAMCRQYNDYGSLTRDRAENNLNSLDFEEFRVQAESEEHRNQNGETNGVDQSNSLEIDATKKGELMAIAEFERLGLNITLKKLRKVVDEVEVMNKMQVFVDVTDTFGQIYVQKDYGTSRKN